MHNTAIPWEPEYVSDARGADDSHARESAATTVSNAYRTARWVGWTGRGDNESRAHGVRHFLNGTEIVFIVHP